MELRRKILDGAICRSGTGGQVGDRDFIALITETVMDRMSDITMASGMRPVGSNGVPALAQHDSDIPIARAYPWRAGEKIYARFKFPPEGTSAKSDEYLRLVKTGVLDTVSIGFMVHKAEPLGNGGYRYLDWSLLEVSVVSVPALASAVVTAKSRGSRTPFLDAARTRLAMYARAPGVQQARYEADLRRRVAKNQAECEELRRR